MLLFYDINMFSSDLFAITRFSGYVICFVRFAVDSTNIQFVNVISQVANQICVGLFTLLYCG
jgi:hypothetical protein